MALYHLGVAVALESFAVMAKCDTYRGGRCVGCRDYLLKLITTADPTDNEGMGKPVANALTEEPAYMDWLLENL